VRRKQISSFFFRDLLFIIILSKISVVESNSRQRILFVQRTDIRSVSFRDRQYTSDLRNIHYYNGP
jgi:cell division protein FtsL